MQNLHADFNGLGRPKALSAFRCDDVSVGYEVKKGDTVPYARVKFDEFEPEDGFYHIVAFIQKAPLSLQLCRNTSGTKNLFGSRICVCADEDLCFYLFCRNHTFRQGFFTRTGFVANL
ncbi:hypothetical protein HanRHA438_Chr13g0627281 [Helianthus annuus]|nr:hypothetical protein HanRHA438_Chr13g0627281 [Helianthus annuus]